jgi:Uma2 family endonuclease
LKYL